MRRNLLFAAVLVVVAVVGGLFFSRKSSTVTQPVDSPEVKFTGTITDTDTGCWADGICRIKVEDKWVTAEIGGLRPPNAKIEVRGQLLGISFSKDTSGYIGRKVKVYAKRVNDNYFTIYGNANYYIELLD